MGSCGDVRRGGEEASVDEETRWLCHCERLNVLELQYLPCLRSFDANVILIVHHQSQLNGEVLINACRSSLCQYPRKISIVTCNAISVLIPWYVVGQMKSLEELDIRYCETIRKVFDEGSESGTTLTTPTVLLKTTNHVPQLYNLKRVEISNCDLLSHVFTFSTLESLKQLKFLSIEHCNAIQEIVKQEINGTTSSKDDHVVVLLLGEEYVSMALIGHSNHQ
ncbi:hypothetical protein R6Q59_005253 [Mikania micrantha]